MLEPGIYKFVPATKQVGNWIKLVDDLLGSLSKSEAFIVVKRN